MLIATLTNLKSLLGCHYQSRGKEQTMSKKKPCGLDYCPQEEIIGAYASCSACAWGNDDNDESKEEIKEADKDTNVRSKEPQAEREDE
jgi:hypothetical protein